MMKNQTQPSKSKPLKNDEGISFIWLEFNTIFHPFPIQKANQNKFVPCVTVHLEISATCVATY